DIVQEGMRGAHRLGAALGRVQLNWSARSSADGDVICRVRDAIIADVEDHLREAVLPWNELAVKIGAQQRDIEDFTVGELDPAHRPGLVLAILPGGEAPVCTVKHMACSDRLAVAVQLVLPEKNLMRGARRVGLVLINTGGGNVDALPDVVG